MRAFRLLTGIGAQGEGSPSLVQAPLLTREMLAAMWQLVGTIALPVISALLAALSNFSARRVKPLERYAELLGKLEKAEAAADEIAQLMAEEASALRAREARRRSRPLNKINLAAAIVLAGLSGMLFFYTWSFVTTLLSPPPAVLSTTILVVVGTVGVIFTAAGFMQIYEPPKPRSTTTTPDESETSGGTSS